MMKRIVLFKGKLDTLNLFSAQLRKGFEQLGGYEIYEVDLRDMIKGLGGLYTFLQDGSITAMIAFNSTFYGMTLPSGVNMCEQLRIPCINILVDHPYWYPDILRKTPSVGVVLCVDRGHMDYVNRFYPEIEVTGFLPHGGTPMEGMPKPIRERTIEVLYAGSLLAEYAEKQKPDFTQWDFPAEAICETAIQKLLQNPHLIIEQVLENTLRDHQVQMSDAELQAFISSCVYIERVVSSYFREKAVAAVAQAGIPLELYGDGWGECSFIKLPNVHYGGRISPEEVLRKMENTKIVLNTMPWFRDGSHERVFNGMLRGAVVCSETSNYLKEELPPDVWVPYDPSTIDSLPERIQALLQDTDAMQEIADRGYALAKEKHTWQARAMELHQDLLGG
ncbi:MAG: glycosyltransferase [Acetatifactor sp.]|nr:glycosyltransferase [Acetatifactor sp.]